MPFLDSALAALAALKDSKNEKRADQFADNSADRCCASHVRGHESRKIGRILKREKDDNKGR